MVGDAGRSYDGRGERGGRVATVDRPCSLGRADPGEAGASGYEVCEPLRAEVDVAGAGEQRLSRRGVVVGYDRGPEQGAGPLGDAVLPGEQDDLLGVERGDIGSDRRR